MEPIAKEVFEMSVSLTPPRDLRQRKTRSALVKALLELLEEQPFRSLSVVDICQKAMVHRTTFYAHFEDRESLLQYTLSTLTQEFFPTPAEDADLLEAFLRSGKAALSFIQSHQRLYTVGLREEVGTVEHALETTFSDLVCARLQHSPLRQSLPNMDPAIGAHFFAGGLVSVVHWWVEQDFPVPAEEILAHMRRLLTLVLLEREAVPHG